MENQNKEEILITGHLNPDTDSICAAIAYADLKNRTSEGSYIACRAGAVSAETAWVLKRFGLKEPRLLEDVAPQVRDAEIRRVRGISGELTVKQVWEIMRDNDVSTLPIIDKDKRLIGLISLKDIAVAFMDSFNSHALSVSNTPFADIAKTLEGEILLGDPSAVMTKGRIQVGAGNPEMIREYMQPGDLMILSNRESSQRAAIESGASCIVVTTFADVSDEVMELAKSRGCVIISTPYDTHKASYYINQSVPVRYYMAKNDLRTFSLSTPIDDVLSVMGKTRFVYFPVRDEKGRYYGLISRRNMINRRRKQLILVDHNEKSQVVPGWEEADIREIVDHHRVGGIQTISPIFFRNQPLGSTCTIITQMYKEHGLEIPKDVAGAMLCAILSDTLMFRSPTCTEIDKEYAKELAEIAGVDLKKTGEAMFEAGEDLSGKTGDDLLHGDYKIFTAYDKRFGVSQSMFLSPASITKAIGLSADALQEMPRAEDTAYSYYLLTDITKESSRVLCAGNGAEDLLRAAFGLGEDDELLLKGVVSRKKQFVPAIIEELRRESE
ncbi:MAG: putative manganese-dependent inorganic diphosphatase [Firmicutes bacterium]|nr:putative manganese-dependent inorganic diphosphatase [Bacillota bacterium]